MTLRFGPSPIAETMIYHSKLAQALAKAVLATREPEQEARVYCRSIDEVVLCLDVVLKTLDALGTLDTDKSLDEVRSTRRCVLELKNGSAIVFSLDE